MSDYGYRFVARILTLKLELVEKTYDIKNVMACVLP